MPDFGELFDKAKDLASEHPDQVHQGIDKVQELAEDHLGSQFEGQIEKAGDLAEGFLGVHQTPDNEGQSDGSGPYFVTVTSPYGGGPRQSLTIQVVTGHGRRVAQARRGIPGNPAVV